MVAPDRRPRRAVTLVKLLGILIVTGVLAAGVLLPVIGGVGLTGKTEADRFLNASCNLNETAPTAKTTLFASDGTTVIAQLFDQNRTPVSISVIPKTVQQALIDTEDRRFYDHHGVDMRGLLRAAANNSSDGGTQGGSTLTMQYVKQLRYYNAKSDAERAAAIDQTIDRKIQDAKCAIDLEKRESKSQILENYFNIAFFGENSYGIQSAAQTYFSKNAQDLTVAEGAMITGLVQSPTKYDPFNDPQAALDRRNVVLDNMASAGDLSAADLAPAKASPLGLSATTPPPVSQGCSYTNGAIANAGFFCDYAVSWLGSHGFDETTLRHGGYNIVTTLDAGLQNSGQLAVWSGSSSVRGGSFAADSPSALVMPSVDPKTGNVTTMITSRAYPPAGAAPVLSQTSNPLFTLPTAGAGSTYKYFTALTALESGASSNLTLTTAGAYPAKYTVKNCNLQEPYGVSNAGNYNATLPMDKALYQSSNTYFVGLEDQYFNCDITPIVDTAVDLGMKALTITDLNGNSNVPGPNEATFTLGQKSTSPLELTEAYATIANDGVYCPSNAILKMTDASTGADVAVQHDACAQKVPPQIARELVQILVNDTTTSGGTATSIFGSWYGSGGSKVASKTGTNNATGSNGKDDGTNSALWFVGVTPNLVSAAAVFNPESPTKTISKLPGYSDGYASGDAFGAASGAYFLKAYGPALKATPWTWGAPNDVAGTTVPNVTGKSQNDATNALTAAGFVPNILSYQCGTSARAGTVSGYAPTKAEPGATITACISTGRGPSNGGYTAPAAPRRTPTTPSNPGNGGNGGANNNGDNNGGSTMQPGNVVPGALITGADNASDVPAAPAGSNAGSVSNGGTTNGGNGNGGNGNGRSNRNGGSGRNGGGGNNGGGGGSR